MLHKTDLSQIKRITPEALEGESDQYRGPSGGVWIRRPKSRRIRATLVDEKKEQIQFARWILVWVFAIPLSALALWWLGVLIQELYFFTS